MTARTGQCLCGAVTFSTDDASPEHTLCHCKMCQRWSGGPFLTVTAANLVFEGKENLSRFQSSAWAERGFCNKCGSSLFYRLSKSDRYAMCVGVFDETDDFVMDEELFIDRKPAGYAFAGDHPRLTEAETMAKYKEFSA